MSERTQRQLRTLSTGLVVYGVVGIVLAVVLLGAVVAISRRLDSLAGRLSDRLETISQTVDKTADRARRTRRRPRASFATTLDQAGPDAPAGRHARSARWSPRCASSRPTAAAVTILGQTPLASLSDRFGRIADQLETLQGQVAHARRQPGGQPVEPGGARDEPDRPGRPSSARSTRSSGPARSRPASTRSCRSSGWASRCSPSGSRSRRSPRWRSASGSAASLRPEARGAARRAAAA